MDGWFCVTPVQEWELCENIRVGFFCNDAGFAMMAPLAATQQLLFMKTLRNSSDAGTTTETAHGGPSGLSCSLNLCCFQTWQKILKKKKILWSGEMIV